jgi:hypothetical protein
MEGATILDPLYDPAPWHDQTVLIVDHVAPWHLGRGGNLLGPPAQFEAPVRLEKTRYHKEAGAMESSQFFGGWGASHAMSSGKTTV